LSISPSSRGKKIIEALRGKLVVSCQAYPDDPMEHTETLRRVAQSAALGGASGFRLNSPEHVRAVRQNSSLPIIAIQKTYKGGQLRITPDFASAKELADAGADIIALDCTDRTHVYGEPWREIVRRIHEELGLLVMADIATLEDGIRAAEAGVDFVAPTLHGYTEETKGSFGFHPELVTALAQKTGKPVIAEGNVSTPALARRAIDAGAWCVVVGSAITRPGTITSTFVEALKRTQANSSGYVIGIDVGGTRIKAAVVREHGDLLFQHDLHTNAGGGREGITHALRTAVEDTLSKAKEAELEIVGIGVASAGAIDSKNGTVFAATDNLPGWAGFDIRGYLRSLTDLPVFVENDAQAAALAELRFGHGQNVSSFVTITIGTGIGAGIVIDGKLIRGTHGFAGTVGHQTIRFDGRPCNCGRRGCLEAYVSTEALIHEYLQSHPTSAASISISDLAREISELSLAGDPAARAAYTRLAIYLSEGLANVFNMFDPETIVLGGGLIQGHEYFIEEVQNLTEERLHFGRQRPPKLVAATARRHAGVLGAAVSAFDNI
jgi:glucokinase-like ROK family protein